MRSIWQGTRVRLRAVEPDDWEAFAAMSDDDYTARRSSWISFPASTAAIRQWTEKVATSEPEDDKFRWAIVNPEDQVVGTILTHTCERRPGTFMYGLVIAAPYQRRGYAREAVAIVLRYMFQELGYQKVTVHVYEFNEPSQRFHERFGFQLEGRLRRMVFTGGQYHDVLVYGLLREEFQTELPPLSDDEGSPA